MPEGKGAGEAEVGGDISGNCRLVFYHFAVVECQRERGPAVRVFGGDTSGNRSILRKEGWTFGRRAGTFRRTRYAWS